MSHKGPIKNIIIYSVYYNVPQSHYRPGIHFEKKKLTILCKQNWGVDARFYGTVGHSIVFTIQHTRFHSNFVGRLWDIIVNTIDDMSFL
jgi:hypothetical protein